MVRCSLTELTFHVNNLNIGGLMRRLVILFVTIFSTVFPAYADQSGPTFKDCPVCPEMVVIPGGSFNMGSDDGQSSERPMHKVNVPSFALAKTEVTQGQWQAIMGCNPSHNKECGDDCPVENVSWDDAQYFVYKLSKATGNRYRLPSEAEWEYACRAGSQETYCGSDILDYVGWYLDNSSRRIHKVGQKHPNRFGLYDMSGNVREWVEDCWNSDYKGAPTNGAAWKTGTCEMKVRRDGSWNYSSENTRATVRDWFTDMLSNDNLGFRPAMDIRP